MMTLPEVRDHAQILQDHLDHKRHQVEQGRYTGSLEDNLNLITALDGRVTELLALCGKLQDQETAAALAAA